MLFFSVWDYSIVLNYKLNKAFTVWKCKTRKFHFLRHFILTEVFPQKSELNIFW